MNTRIELSKYAGRAGGLPLRLGGEGRVRGRFVERAGVRADFLLGFVALLLLLGTVAAPGADKKPVFLYTRYFNAEGEERYSPDTTYKDILDRLRAHNIDVRVDAKPLTAQSLTGVNVILIANPSDKAVEGHPPPHHFDSKDIDVIARFVQRGGGLIIMGNQENHNLEVEDTNKLLARFGLQFASRMTDAKKLVLPTTTPIIGGLRWAYYTGNQIVIDSKHPAKPRSLVTNDLSQKPVNGNRDEPGSLLAIAEPGRGRVVVVTDAGWIANFALSERGVPGVAIKGQDNAEIFDRLVAWAAHIEPKR